ncbi:MAG: N-formylglutamate amidohydrolase [Pseudomonadota bacterium]
MTSSAFKLTRPTGTPGHIVFSSPHSGDEYPAQFLRDSQLDAHTLRSSEDAFVDRLFASAPGLGATLISSRIPRAYVDLNREETELDPSVVEMERRSGLNPRLAAGLGVIPRVVAEGRVIRPGKITRKAAENRIAQFYRPYHAELEALMTEAHTRFGEAVLYDCHSMPRDALRGHTARGGKLPEIVLGDRFGSSCAPRIMAQALSAFEAEGFRVVCNAPFAGGYITQAYGRPEKGWHCLQIEIDRSLYMDEAAIRPRGDFEAFRVRLDAVVERLIVAKSAGFSVAAE